MPRPRGRRNEGFDATRAALLARVLKRLEATDGPGLSLSEMAAAADVSVPTLRHYFGDRSGLLRAVLEHQHAEGEPYLREVAAAPLPPLEPSIRAFLAYFATGVRQGVGRMLMVAITNGMRDAEVARACLSELIEPIVRALELRLARHQAQGEMRPGDVRHAALALIGPVLLALQHQDELGGRSYRALDVDAFLDDLAASFARAYGVQPPIT